MANVADILAKQVVWVYPGRNDVVAGNPEASPVQPTSQPLSRDVVEITSNIKGK